MNIQRSHYNIYVNKLKCGKIFSFTAIANARGEVFVNNSEEINSIEPKHSPRSHILSIGLT